MLRWPGDKIVLKPRSTPVPTPSHAPAQHRQSTPAPPPAAAVPGPSPLSAAQTLPPHKMVACPFCQHQQPAGLHVLSLFCKNCNRRINLEGQDGNRMSQFAPPSLRAISCPGCQATQEVPSNALSAFCQKCGKRINMQDYQIRGKFNGDIQTKGTLTVALGGDVRADVRVGNAVIEGRLLGTIRADGKVELRSTGFIQGDIYARTIVVHEGATFLGHCEIIQPK